MMVISIFDLEKRTNLKKETIKLHKYLSRKVFEDYDHYTGNFYNMVNSCIELWPDRYTATNINDFFDQYGISFDIKNFSNNECLYYLQFIINFIKWIYEEYEKESNKNDTSYYNYHFQESDNFSNIVQNNNSYFITIMQNIEHIAELCNYNIEIINEHFTFIKRDADVDSILPILENEDDLRIALLEYNDFRIENNREEKKIILKKIGDYLEPNRRELSSLNKSLTDDVFFILNKFYIRHNNDGNTKFDTNEEYILWYDNLFKMMIQLIRTKNIKEIQNQLKDFKK